MRFNMTKHAEAVVANRGIKAEWIEAALEVPESTHPDPEDGELQHVLRKIPEFGNRVLRVVFNQTKSPAVIVTAYFDRTMKGRL